MWSCWLRWGPDLQWERPSFAGRFDRIPCKPAAAFAQPFALLTCIPAARSRNRQETSARFTENVELQQTGTIPACNGLSYVVPGGRYAFSFDSSRGFGSVQFGCGPDTGSRLHRIWLRIRTLHSAGHDSRNFATDRLAQPGWGDQFDALAGGRKYQLRIYAAGVVFGGNNAVDFFSFGPASGSGHAPHDAHGGHAKGTRARRSGPEVVDVLCLRARDCEPGRICRIGEKRETCRAHLHQSRRRAGKPEEWHGEVRRQDGTDQVTRDAGA